MSGRLPDPPMIVTNIPTNQDFGDGTERGINRYRTAIPDNDHAIDDIAVLAGSIQQEEFRRGVGVTVRSASATGGFGLTYFVHVAMHPASGEIAKYQSGWTDVQGSYYGIGSGNFGEGRARGRIFSQRQGEYTYAILDCSTEPFHNQRGIKFNRSEFLQTWYDVALYLSDFSPIFDIRGDFFVSDDADPFIWHISGQYNSRQSGDCQLKAQQSGTFVIGLVDDGSPSGGVSFSPDRTGGNPFSSTYGYYLGPGQGYLFSGKSAAFRQKYQMPPGTWGHGPYFVHPWSSGSYNPPELWFFLYEFDARGYVTGRFKIYRSRWKKGAYVRYDNPDPSKPLGYFTEIAGPEGSGPIPVDPTTFNLHPDRPRSFEEMPVVITDDPQFMLGPNVTGGTRYPRLNPDGYAFEHDWYNDAHLVGTVGPFPNLRLYNPAETAAAAAQNTAYGFTGGVVPTGFKVMRDRKRRGILHFVMSVSKNGHTEHTSGIFDSNLFFNGIWFTTSGDDGKHWDRPQQAAGPHGYPATSLDGAGGHIAYGYVNFESLRAIRTYEGQTLASVNYIVVGTGGINAQAEYILANRKDVNRYMPGDRGALFVVDYINSGVGNAKENGVVFKNGELAREAWL